MYISSFLNGQKGIVNFEEDIEYNTELLKRTLRDRFEISCGFEKHMNHHNKNMKLENDNE